MNELDYNCLEGQPQYISYIDPSRDDLQEIFTMLTNTTIPLISNGTGRAKTFGSHRCMTLGYITARNTKIFGLSYHTKRNETLYKSIVEFGKTFVPFEFNAIHINHNVVCPKHKDSRNINSSCIISMGDYTGCDLIIEGFGEYNTNCRPLVFDGANSFHYNTPLISGLSLIHI